MFDFWSSVVGGREDGGEQLSLSWEAGQCPRRVTPLSLPANSTALARSISHWSCFSGVLPNPLLVPFVVPPQSPSQSERAMTLPSAGLIQERHLCSQVVVLFF